MNAKLAARARRNRNKAEEERLAMEQAVLQGRFAMFATLSCVWVY